jgi:Ser/Thr protein kinase RdoA (MazF antagonist)
MPDGKGAAGHPYQALTPDVVMDALASVGLQGDGRQMPLSSYENRVYQLHLEEGGAVVAKFYRPQRWSKAQILEEHAFSHELDSGRGPGDRTTGIAGSHAARVWRLFF